MKFYRAFYNSRSSSFEAYALTEKDAVKLLVKGLKNHTKHANYSDNNWFYEESIKVYEVELNRSFCDYE